MYHPFQCVFDLNVQADAIRSRRYGAIEVVDDELVAVHLRPWPKIVSIDMVLLARWYHRWRSGNRCVLYYNEPLRCPGYLSVTHAASRRHTTFGSIRRALGVLDQIARIKRSDAIVCDVWNGRVSDRMLSRWGWQPLPGQRRRRQFIKRLYGMYPDARMSANRPAAEPIAG